MKSEAKQPPSPILDDGGYSNITYRDVHSLLRGSSDLKLRGYYHRARYLSASTLGIDEFESWARDQSTLVEPVQYLTEWQQARLEYYRNKRYVLYDLQKQQYKSFPLLCRGMPAYQARQGDFFDFLQCYLEVNKITCKYIVLSPRAEYGCSPVLSLSRMNEIANKFISFISRFLGYRPDYTWTMEPTERGTAHINFVLVDVEEFIPFKVINDWWEKQGLGTSQGVSISNVEPQDSRKAINYILKYINKVNGAGGHPVWQSILTLSGRRSYGISSNLRKKVQEWILAVVATSQENAKLKVQREKIKADAEAYNKRLHSKAQYYASKGLINSNKFISVGVMEHQELIEYLQILNNKTEKPPPDQFKTSFYTYLAGPPPAPALDRALMGRRPLAKNQHGDEWNLIAQANRERARMSLSNSTPYHVQQAERLLVLLDEGLTLSAIFSQYPDLQSDLVQFSLQKLMEDRKHDT